MIMALEITWENQPTLFLGLGADDRCHIGGRRNVLCKVKTKGNNKDINREEIIRYKNISNFSRWWRARQRWRKRRRVFLLWLRESAIGLSSLAGITRFFCLYDQIQIQIPLQIQIHLCKLSFWWIFMSNALQGTSQHLSQLQKVFFISMFGTFMICTQLKPSSSLAFSQIVLWFYCRALESTQTHSPPLYFVPPRIWSHLIFTTIGILTFIIINHHHVNGWS